MSFLFNSLYVRSLEILTEAPNVHFASKGLFDANVKSGQIVESDIKGCSAYFSFWRAISPLHRDDSVKYAEKPVAKQVFPGSLGVLTHAFIVVVESGFQNRPCILIWDVDDATSRRNIG